MEAWYDAWLKAIGAAAIVGPSDCAGQIPPSAVADMAGPKRGPCRRLESRMMILCDGRVVSCEEDVLGRQELGNIGGEAIGQIWRSSAAPLRAEHAAGRWEKCELCARCSEWHRP
jgi:radical SAM protein with 4Fe4S-binding SPASM domain